MKNRTINLYTEWLPLIEGLSDADAGKLLKDIFKYQNGEEVNNDNPVWSFIKSKIDDYNQNGINISKVRSEAGKKGMQKRWGITKITNDNNCYQKITNDNKNNNKIKENNKRKEIKEKKPTLAEVESYAQARGRPDLAGKFFNYFDATDWVDSNGKEVKNWKSKFLTWESHNEKPKEPKPETWWRA